MVHVYEQFERSRDVIGVPVTVCVIDPNGNDSYLTAVSNANGNFAVEFKPEVEGVYEIYAYFDGLALYLGSSVEGKLLVSATGSVVGSTHHVSGISWCGYCNYGFSCHLWSVNS